MNARTLSALLLLATGGLSAPADDGAPPPPVQPRALEAAETIRPPEPLPPRDTVESSTLSAKDVAFLQKTAQSLETMLKLAEITQARAASDPVRFLTAVLLREQAQTLAELRQLAKAAGLVLTTPEPTRQAAVLGRFAKIADSELERAFLEEVIALDKSNMADFEEISASAGANEIKTFARRLLPAMRELLVQTEALHREVLVAGSLASSLPRQ